jgi:OmpA family protein
MSSRSLFLIAAAALLLGACDQPAPPAAPPPPMQPPVAQTFRVLFASGSSTLQTPELATVRQAAVAYKARPGGNIVLTGSTDTTGSAAYNQVLSQRRVAAVTAALGAEGVPSTAITSSATGETNPPVQTGDQVSDQKNRSVAIVVSMPPPSMTDAQYCGMLAPKVREVSRGNDPSGNLGRALANCQSGTGDYGIPTMTQFLMSNNVPVPPRT